MRGSVALNSLAVLLTLVAAPTSSRVASNELEVACTGALSGDSDWTVIAVDGLVLWASP